MIEGLILLAELVAMGLLLWHVRNLDRQPEGKGMGIFDVKNSTSDSTTNAHVDRPADHA